MSDDNQPTPDWQHLKQYGYAPGNYMNRCVTCQQVVCDLDKRATTCRACAQHQHEAALAPPPPAQPVAWWIPKAEQFALAKKDGSRPFAKAWEPLYATPQPPAQPAVIYSPLETSPHAEKDGKHPNDHEPKDPARWPYLVERGDNEGQGLSAYWKWGHAAGWNDHKRHVAPQPPQDAKDAERIKKLAIAYGNARAAEAYEDEPAYFKSKREAVQESLVALFAAIDAAAKGHA